MCSLAFCFALSFCFLSRPTPPFIGSVRGAIMKSFYSFRINDKYEGDSRKLHKERIERGNSYGGCMICEGGGI